MSALIPGTAEAHLITTGLGSVYDGVAHLALSPEDLVPVAGLAVLAGLRGPAHGRWALFVLPVFWLVGGAAGLLMARPASNFAAAISFCWLAASWQRMRPCHYGPRLRSPRFSPRPTAMQMDPRFQATAVVF